MPSKRSNRFRKFVHLIKSQRPNTWKGTTLWTGKLAIAGVIGGLVVAMLIAIYLTPAQASVASVQKKAETQAARAELRVIPDAPPAAAAGTSAAKSQVAASRVTITGCLERDDDSFRLSDTTGTNTPTSRSWKSGFLKKRNARIDVVDSVKRLNLASHVGERVSVTGTLVDKEMQAGSLQRVATSCAGAPRA
jgi:zona occludens toxin (predicted ATPase)